MSDISGIYSDEEVLADLPNATSRVFKETLGDCPNGFSTSWMRFQLP